MSFESVYNRNSMQGFEYVAIVIHNIFQRILKLSWGISQPFRITFASDWDKELMEESDPPWHPVWDTESCWSWHAVERLRIADLTYSDKSYSFVVAEPKFDLFMIRTFRLCETESYFATIVVYRSLLLRNNMISPLERFLRISPPEIADLSENWCFRRHAHSEEKRIFIVVLL